eukprot:scaffold3337_cov169-Amphora_coffeaeformis.AAC.18
MSDAVAAEQRYFNDRLYELLDFRADNNHCRVPRSGYGDLGKWVKSLRTQYRKQQLPEKRVKILNSLGFDWDTRHYERTPDSEAKWNERFAMLVEYKRIHGNTMVPQNSGELGRWVKMQREQKKTTDRRKTGDQEPSNKRPRPCMPPERIAKLDSIGFCWESGTRRGWEERFEELLQYRAQHGDCNVPQLWSENRALGRWVMKQRCHYNLKKQGKKSQLTDEKQARLEGIGFAWVAPGYNASSRKRRKIDDEDDEDEQDELEDEVDVEEPVVEAHNYAPVQQQFQPPDYYTGPHHPHRRWF